MDPAQWEHIKELFASALEREPGQRNAFLKESCGDDDVLRAEVESLVAAHQDTRSAASGVDPRSAADQAGLAAGDKFSGRRIGHYQFLRRIGQGGMAAVYLAVRADDQYKKRVAIKLIPPGLDSGELLRRFRNERQTLAALDHPNIVKLLDGGSTDDGLPYLVMDYVEGTPIEEYCDAHRLSTSERLELFRKVCTAVSYAHQRLVIHRDLKPANILVTADGTPKLLDFGIAKLLNPESAATLVITHTGQRLMTPEYASPEQVRGEPLTNATDVYSLGVVLYELLTGHRPYHLKSYMPVEIERAICETEPLKPSTVVTRVEEEMDVDGKKTAITPEAVSRTREGDPKKLRSRLHGDLDAIVLTALRKEPQRRYASVYEFSEDIRKHLEGMPVQARPSTIGYRSSKFVHRHKELAAATLVFVALLGGVIWEAHRVNLQNAEWAGNPKFKSRRSVAVLGFKNLSGKPETNWLSTALAEMLNTELSAGEKLRMIPGENVAQMKLSLALPDTDSLAPNTLARVRKNLGSDFVVLGSYLDLGKDSGERVRLDLHLQDAAAGETVAAVSETGTEAQIFDLVARAGAELRQHLSVGEVTPKQVAEIKATLPSNTEAARLYAEGLAKLRLFDALSARDLLQQAVAADPNYAMAHSALAEAWMKLGYDERAKEEAKKAFDLSMSLSSEERLLVEGRYRQADKEWDKALAIYKTLFKSYPDNLDYGLLLSETETLAGRRKDALGTAESLRNLPAPARDDPRIDAAEARTARNVGDRRRALAASTRAIAKARTQGARLLLASTLGEHCKALYQQGQPDQASAACEEAKEIFDSAGDRNGLALILDIQAYFLTTQGNFDRALELEDKAQALFREVGNRRGLGWAVNDVASVHWFRGDLSRAMQMYQRAQTIFEEVADKDSTATAMENYASVLAYAGDPARAKAITERAMAIYQDVNDRSNVALSFANIGRYSVFLGKHGEARKSLDESLAMWKEIGDKDSIAAVLSMQGNILFEEGDLSAAKRKYQEALSIDNQIGEKGNAADDLVAVAELSIEEGRPAEAEASIREAREEFRKEKGIDDQVYAAAVLARDLLAQGKSSEAQKEIEGDWLVIAKSQNLFYRLGLEVDAARVRTALGRSAAAQAELQAAIGKAKRAGFLGRELEARLALGESEIRSGRRAAGRARLQALEKEARAKGFELIARKAAAARG